ncbi:hypothetical protein [Pseudomonas retamae]|uniref:Uncharacterized protein n=1 Tax=Pseudomonas retamae TaxID=702110 RepID=A0ABW7D459_9PSED
MRTFRWVGEWRFTVQRPYEKACGLMEMTRRPGKTSIFLRRNPMSGEASGSDFNRSTAGSVGTTLNDHAAPDMLAEAWRWQCSQLETEWFREAK